MSYPSPPPPFASPSGSPVPTPGPTPTRSSWPTAAMIAVAVLAATTVAAVVVGLLMASSANSEADDTEKELRSVERELSQTQSDLDTARDELETAQGDLEAERTERQAAEDRLSALRSLFPLGPSTFATASLEGSYALTLVGTPECTGYGDNAAACSAGSLPNQLVITRDGNGALRVSSNFFGEVPLIEEFGRFSASGRVLEGVADRCSGVDLETAFTVSFFVGEVGLADDDTLDPTLLFVEYEMGTSGSAECTATNRSVQFDAVPA